MAASLVNQTTGSAGSLANATATITASTAGNFLVAFYARSGGLATGALTSVTDSASQSWTVATRGAAAGVQHSRIECWYMPNSASITSVTFNSTVAQTNSWNIVEFSGLVNAAPLDVASPDNSAAALSTSVTTPSITTVDADLILAAIHYAQTSGALQTPGFTTLNFFDDGTVGSGRAAYWIGASAGSYSANWTLGIARAAGVITVGFKSVPTPINPAGISIPVTLGFPMVSLAGGPVPRPNTGTVTRPNTGVVARPNTGTVTRP